MIDQDSLTWLMILFFLITCLPGNVLAYGEKVYLDHSQDSLHFSIKPKKMT